MEQKPKKVIVIGSGLGGISAAISLAQEGYAVSVHEKNEKIGGKLNVLKQDGYTFDLGPSILTLPHIFERLFERSHRKLADYISIRPLRPHWRNFFEDGTTVDLVPEPERMAAEAQKVGESPEALRRYLEYSARLYDLVDRGYFQQGLDNGMKPGGVFVVGDGHHHEILSLRVAHHACHGGDVAQAARLEMGRAPAG